MDILTQGLLGAGLAQSGAEKNELRLATGIGLVAGLLADADVLIQSSADPLLQIEYHRHFSHSIFFIPIGALIAALLLWPFIRNRLSFGKIYRYSLLGYMFSGFLDVCTSYGTYWLWPVVDRRLAFNIISIIDPLFTLVIILGIALGWRMKTAISSRIALVLAGCYLLFGWFQHERALSEMIAIADERGHRIERMLVKPTMGNNLLWRSIYESEGMFYVDAIRVGLGDTIRYTGGSARKYRPEETSAPPPPASLLAIDIRRFIEFSDDFVIQNGDSGNRLGDVRYAMLPTRIEPLWGIAFDSDHPDQHASYHFYRKFGVEERRLFFDMLTGKAKDDRG